MTSPEVAAAAPPDWYLDPTAPGRLRYWDGGTWTTWVARRDHEGPDSSASSRATATTEAVDIEVVDAEPDWCDLAQNRPGEAARQKAHELRRAAPFTTFFARVTRRPSDERSWRLGADGEVEVGRRLRSLGDELRTLHAVPVGQRGSDIDLVVIGPAGVFTLNTKHHRDGKVWVAERAFVVNGQKTSYLPNSRFEAQRASRLLSAVCGQTVTVEPVIVVMAAKLKVKAQPTDVHVVGRRSLVAWLKDRPVTLSDDQVTRIYHFARRDSTWRPAGA